MRQFFHITPPISQQNIQGIFRATSEYHGQLYTICDKHKEIPDNALLGLRIYLEH